MKQKSLLLSNELALLGPSKMMFHAVLEAYLASFPVEKHSVGREINLVNLLNYMEEEGMIKMPSRKGRGWTPYANHSQPDWIQIVKQKKPKLNNDVAWHPRMRWAADISAKSQFDSALLVNEFFKSGGFTGVKMPVNEVSLKIFGDEKKLSKMSKNNSSIFNGKILLSELGCQDDSHPIAYEKYKGSKTSRVLILENLATYYTFSRWNRENQQYRYIVYGAGGAFGSSHMSLAQLDTDAPEYEYFGDMDLAGIQIPFGVKSKREDLGLPPVVPQVWLYEQMMLSAIRSKVESKPGIAREDALLWLPSSIREEADNIIRSGDRIAQEVINSEWLFGYCHFY